jgi:hypothetical protein
MATFFKLLLGYMWDCFRSHERLKAEILILRHQLNILHRKAPKRLRLSGGDRGAAASSLMPCWADFTIATRGYSFRKGQVADCRVRDGPPLL